MGIIRGGIRSNQGVSTGDSPSFVGLTIGTGDLDIAGNLLTTTNLALVEGTSTRFHVRNRADGAYKDLVLDSLRLQGGIFFDTDADAISSANADNLYILMKARNNGDALVEIARFQGADDPHFAVNSQEDGRNLAFNYGNINITNYKVVKVTKSHTSDLFDAAATMDNVTIWTQPVNARLISVMMRLETQFAGTSWSDLRVTIGLTGDEDGLVATTGNLFSDAADTEYENVGAYYDTFYEGLHGKTNATIDWKAYATSTGGNLSASTAGTMDFYFLYEQP